MSSHENRPRQVIKPLATVLARVALAGLVPMVLATPIDLVRGAARTTDPIGPAFPPDFFVTFTFIQEFVQVAHDEQNQNYTMSSKPNKSHLV
jgi:hypothetical protein